MWCYNIQINMRNFEDWWKTVPIDLQQKTRKGDEQNRPLLNQVSYALLNLHLAGKHDAKPSLGTKQRFAHVSLPFQPVIVPVAA
jgi:hypothetical protein